MNRDTAAAPVPPFSISLAGPAPVEGVGGQAQGDLAREGVVARMLGR